MKNLLILSFLLLTNLLPAQDKERDPQWLMPLYFRDANGDRDTVYFGYDPEASTFGEGDTILGEKWIRIDTSKFNIYLWNYPNVEGGTFPLINDTVKKVDIRSGYIGTSIGFCKGKLPISMKWLDSLLYVPSCPGPDIAPRPKARIDLTCSDYDFGWSCNPIDGPPLSLTDYPAPEIPFPISDSMVFDGSGLYPPSDVIINTVLRLVPHNYTYDEIIDQKSESIKVFPNPFTDKIYVQSLGEKEYSFRILTLTGVCLINDRSFNEQLTLNGITLTRGIYIIELRSEKDIFIQKIVKTE